MSKRIKTHWILLLSFLFVGLSCQKDNSVIDSPTFKVSFSVDGVVNGLIPDQFIGSGQLATQPENPEKAGYSFEGWLLNGSTFNFDTPITSNIILIANFVYNQTDPSVILPEDYVQQLGKGFDVTFAEFSTYINAYSEQVVADIAAAGFSNVRIRMNQENLDATFLNMLKQQVDDCLAHGLYPILAYQGHYVEDENTTFSQDINHLTNWWQTIAETFQDYDYKLTYNILVEISGQYKNDPDSMNLMYQSVHDAIRSFDQNRIIIYPPVKISNPSELVNLEIPNAFSDPYQMAEWHFYAAGPKKEIGNSKYWLDGTTDVERNNIKGPIQTAVNWMNSTGHVTWVGAWMAGNYNQGNEYTIPEQVTFASYMCRQLAANNLPWSINADNKYYDYNTNSWFEETNDAAGIPVRDVLINPNSVMLYQNVGYTGNATRLTPGQYTLSELSALGIDVNNVHAIMVPFDYKVTMYSEDNFSGTTQQFMVTDRSISVNFQSLKVDYLNQYN